MAEIKHNGGMLDGRTAGQRKQAPLYRGLVKYFPRALVAVSELSRLGNEQHNPGSELHWDRSKSGDEMDALMRHALDAGTFDNDGARHSTKVAWRALANLEKELEAADAPQVDVADIKSGSVLKPLSECFPLGLMDTNIAAETQRSADYDKAVNEAIDRAWAEFFKARGY